MTSYYCSGAKEIISSIKAPYSGLMFDIVEYPDKKGMVFLRFYADNLYSYSDSQLVSIAEWINKVLNSLNSAPLMAKYTWECIDEY